MIEWVLAASCLYGARSKYEKTHYGPAIDTLTSPELVTSALCITHTRDTAICDMHCECRVWVLGLSASASVPVPSAKCQVHRGRVASCWLLVGLGLGLTSDLGDSATSLGARQALGA